MAHAFIMDFDGATTEQYDAVMADMDLGGRLPDGALFHAAGTTDGGLLVCDVWETPEAFQAFADTKIGPLSARHGIAPPRVRAFEATLVRQGVPGPVALMQVVTLAGADAATFERLDSEVLGPERRTPDACVYHVTGALDDDWVVLDYWSDRDVYDAFIAERVAPVAAAAGVGKPAIEAVAVHNALTPGAAAA